MTNSQIFIIDTNVFIEAHRRYYAFDIAPAFWDNLVQFGLNGRIISPDKVKHELERGKDDLADWGKAHFPGFVTTNEDGIIKCYGEIMEWVSNQQKFTEDAIAEFADCADGWLIALAKNRNQVLVTHEQYNAEKKSRVLIPNVCRPLGIECIDTFEMLRRLKVQFK